MISAIVAVDNNWGIGYNGELLERIPEDMKYFKDLTTGNGNEKNLIVMGNNTFTSLGRKCLPYRANLIISHQGLRGEDLGEHGYIGYADKGYSIIASTLDTFKKKLKFYKYCCGYDNIFIIGGGQIYKELLPLCDRVYVTKIYKDHKNVDTYFPNLDELDEWTPACCSDIRTYNDLSYQFWQYDRIS